LQVSIITQMPNELKWKKLEQKGEEMPHPRSGHSLTYVGQNRYLMYGGIEDNHSNKIVPNSDVWQLQVGPKDCFWEKKSQDGDQLPRPRT